MITMTGAFLIGIVIGFILGLAFSHSQRIVAIEKELQAWRVKELSNAKAGAQTMEKNINAGAAAAESAPVRV